MPDKDSPAQFYLSLGFQPTDRVDEDELVMELPLRASAD
jgi:hypothetical protein